jgi:signal transduction histidine kinase
MAKTGERISVELSGSLISHQSRPAVLIILRDIRERNRLEEERLRLQKLAAIGELATMVGHDLRNPLQSIENAVYYLKNECAGKPPCPFPQKAKEMLQVIDNSINYADKIIRDLQDFSATKTPRLKKVNINNIVRDALQQSQKPNNVELRTEMGNLAEIEADEDQMKRVFLNITANGVQAMENGGGTLTVSTKQTDGFVEITFKDTGTGISKDNLLKLFTPLFTTRAKGMGMGLPICKKFVENHHGTISVGSEVGKGTAVTVRLPISRKTVEVKIQ